MKRIIRAILCLTLAACGAYEDYQSDDELGTLEQGLTRPAGYGVHWTTSARCTSLSNCGLPKNKELSYRFFASTCSAWWQARMVTAVDNWINIGGDLGWDLTHASPYSDIEIRCGASASLGVATPKGGVTKADGHVEYNGSTVYIDTAEIEGNTAPNGTIIQWSTRTDVQRQRFAINTIVHELGHTIGLGHGGVGAGDPNTSTVMAGWSSGWFSDLRYYSQEEHNMLADYVP